MSTVEDLERKEQSLLDQLKQARESLELARQDALGLHVGDVVLYKSKRHKIARFEMWSESTSKFQRKPWIVAFPQKKNGEWSELSRNLYDQWGIE